MPPRPSQNRYRTLSSLFTAIADAIRAKTGETSQIIADDFPTAINAIPTEGGSIIPSTIPDDGKTRICYKIPEDAQTFGKTITLNFYQNTSTTTVTIDWGDNTTETTTPYAGRVEKQHACLTTGEHIVSLTINDGSIYFGGSEANTIYGNNTSYQRDYIQWVILGDNITQLHSYALSYCSGLQEIRFPSSGFTSIQQNAFEYSGLKSITIPNTVTNISANAFSSCYNLKTVVLPANETLHAIENYMFEYCYSLDNVTMPTQYTVINQGVFRSCRSLKTITLSGDTTNIGSNVFTSCYNLTNINIPSTVTTIGAASFQNCYGLQKIRFNSSTPPTVNSSNTFSGIPTSCIISVPTGNLSAYTSATNYPSSSTYTYIEETL